MFYPMPSSYAEELDGQYFAEIHPTLPIVIGFGTIKARRMLATLKYENLHGLSINAYRKVDILNMAQFLVFKKKSELEKALNTFGTLASLEEAKPEKEEASVEDLIEELILETGSRLKLFPNEYIPCPRCLQLRLSGCSMCNGKTEVTRAMAADYFAYFGNDFPSYGEHEKIIDFLNQYQIPKK